MTALATYSTGTVAVTNGGTTITGTTTIWSSVNARPGDDIVIGTTQVKIIDVVDTTHLTILPYPGSTVSGVSYTILQTSPQRVAGAQAMADVSSLVAFLNQGNAIIYSVMGSAPDPSVGQEGQYALKTNAGAWVLWLRTGGVWVQQSTPVGTTYKGIWSSGSTYSANDVVSRNGTGYISKTTNTNHAPESNPSDWDSIAPKGDVGPAPTISGTSTTSLTVGTGTQTLTTQSGISFTLGQRLLITSADLSKSMSGLVSSYSGTTLVVSVDDTLGAGTAASWNIAITGQKGLQGFQGIPGTQGIQGLTGPAPIISGTSTSSITLGVGAKTLTTQATRSFAQGMRVRVANSDSSRVMTGYITSYDPNSGTLNFTVDVVIGSGTDTSWTVTVAGERGVPGTQGATGTGIQPDATGTIAQRTTYDNQPQGYKFLETDVSPYRLWIKASNTSADWAGPNYIGGTVPIGDLGHITDSIIQTFDFGHIA